MNFLLIGLALLTFLSTLLGGSILLKSKKNLSYFFAFAAGSLIAVSFLDLMPESLEIAQAANIPIRSIMLTIIASFFFYNLLERYFPMHSLEENHNQDNHHGHILGPIGAGSLIIHSFLDGAAIGTAFHVNNSVGLIVAFAVIFHDFTDGINTVAIMLKNKHKHKSALGFLLLDAIAPVLGVIATTLIAIPEKTLAFLLAFFIGEFLYIAAVNLLPETRNTNAKKAMIIMALGILVITVLTSFL